MEARKEKGLHAARQLHAGASLFSTRIALQKAVAPITTLTPTTTLKEHDETHAEEAKHKLTRLAWHIAQLQQEMLDALAPSSEAENDNKNEEDEEQDKNDKDEDEDDDANESDEDEDRDEDETGERKSKKAKRLTTPFTVIEDEDAQLAAMEAACRRHHDRSC
ncbi:hypothetical protein PTSG_08003 [Salpingoeca rosetta]|uniref:AATF leucine zipper-containing domain-containing protein n=1 Tax=Salpingoeca rosetta (strain ATCC 50818 / BSB-021) TaxID=946362 RepID=F2UHQ4_SALR5|nr:uncharacterized protein PTSG_08003 [Salpingoeca rosetta]EGD76654.1 hypothetical protein PTSG_08003 [Salpingoeca rosetta]|eukprot:XP_004991026.1 hypothetical protein PTSG_08003 [Salpingoeca rosetta]